MCQCFWLSREWEVEWGQERGGMDVGADTNNNTILSQFKASLSTLTKVF
jgi:hypothetical protein